MIHVSDTRSVESLSRVYKATDGQNTEILKHYNCNHGIRAINFRICKNSVQFKLIGFFNVYRQINYSTVLKID